MKSTFSKFMIMIAAGGILLLLLGYIFYFQPYYYLFNGGKVAFSPEIRKDLIRSRYVEMIPHGDAIYFCSLEGFEKKNLEGGSEWTKPFRMTSPKMKQAGDYFLVIDILGHDAYLFHKDGEGIRHIRENLPILNGFLNEEGQIALLLEADLSNQIKIYSKDGVPLIERGSVLAQDGAPVSLALSQDGMHLATSYMHVLGAKPEARITMFGFADYQEDLKDFIVRADQLENELVPDLHYFGEKALWLIGTERLYHYPMKASKETYLPYESFAIKGELLQVRYTDNEVILYHDTKEPTNRYAVSVYQWDGKLLTKIFFDQPLRHLAAQKKGYFLVTEDKILKYQKDKMIWQYPFYEALDHIYEISDSQYLIIQPMQYTVWHVERIY